MLDLLEIVAISMSTIATATPGDNVCVERNKKVKVNKKKLKVKETKKEKQKKNKRKKDKSG